MFDRSFRRGLFTLLLLLVIAVPGETQPANAIGMQPAQVVTPWSAFPLTAPITSQSYSIAIGTKGVPAITWQVTTPSAPTSLTVNLQASTDGTTYATIDSTTAAGIRTVFGTYKFIKFTVSATSGGTSPTITVSTVYSLGNAVSTSSGAIYGGGTFTGPLLLPDGSTSAPSLAFSAAPTTGLYRITSGIESLRFIIGGSDSFVAIVPGSINGGIRLGLSAPLAWSSNGNPSSNSYDLQIFRDAANTLALRNGTAAQTFNIYNTYTDASNYERGAIYWNLNTLYIGTQSAGTGTARTLQLVPANGIILASGTFRPGVTDTYTLGASFLQWTDAHFSRSIQGSKSKALTESSATSFTQVAVPQTAGANYAGGKVIYTVYATDGTDSQSLTGEVFFTAVNKAGTETCSIGLVGTEVLAVSAVSTLTCTHTCVTGLVDAVQIASNCVSSLVQTTFTIESRLNMPKTNTVTPQ